LNKQTLALFFEHTNGLEPKNPSFEMGIEIIKVVLKSFLIAKPDEFAQEDYIAEGFISASPRESPIAGYFCNSDSLDGNMQAGLDHWMIGARGIKMIKLILNLIWPKGWRRRG